MEMGSESYSLGCLREAGAREFCLLPALFRNNQGHLSIPRDLADPSPEPRVSLIGFWPASEPWRKESCLTAHHSIPCEGSAYSRS